MNMTEQITGIEHNARDIYRPDSFAVLEDELSSGLSLYWSTAARILRGSGVNLLDPPPDFFSLERNFFSALFLYSYHRAGIPKARRIFYVAVNQCLRGMVTGCDNLLDDEYKKTLETDLPEGGRRFRSVMDIMVSDRVLFEILLEGCRQGEFTYEQAMSASAASLRALTESGAQEASEEGGISDILTPSEVLRTVHHYKTGTLFQCPWALPSTIELRGNGNVAPLKDALYRIGMGCQIMDDMVDLSMDGRTKRHNYVLSLIYHDTDRSEWSWLEAMLNSEFGPKEKSGLLHHFPRAKSVASKVARDFLEAGLGALFAESHKHMAEPTILFLSKQIGADRFMSGRE